MTKLNEFTNKLNITTDKELEEWKLTWSGEYDSIPMEVHKYMSYKIDANTNQLSKLENIIDSFVQ